MAHETRISPEIDANTDWADAVRRFDGWVSKFFGKNVEDRQAEWSVQVKPGGRPTFVLRLAYRGTETRSEFTRPDLDDHWGSMWRVRDAQRAAIDQVIMAEFAGLKQALREWAAELRAEEQPVAAEN